MNITRLATATAVMMGFSAAIFPAPPTLGQTAQAFALFTDAEVLEWNTARPHTQPQFKSRDLGETDGEPTCHSIPSRTAAGEPQINILAPSLDRPLVAPINIDVQFVPAGSVPIRPETFRVCYIGFITMDVTTRITDHVAVLSEGLHVTGAQLPRGHHHLVMLIADQQGHLAHRDAIFDIQ
jgi:hypothetical protein